MKSLAMLGLASLLVVAVAWAAPPAEEPKELKPVSLTVNTAADEDDPQLAPNGLVLYYCSNAKKKWDIMVARRAGVNQKWGAGDILDETTIRTEVDDRPGFLTGKNADGYEYFYFATMKNNDLKNYDIYVTSRSSPQKPFMEAAALNTLDTEADELHPWLTSDGRGLYFSRNTKEGWRVFYVTRKQALGGQGFGEAKMIETLPPDFHHATLTPDGKTMYLQGPLQKGRTGLFVSTWTKEGWGKPEPLDLLNNPEAPTGDRSPSLSRDGSLLYFASDRPGGKGGLDLYVIPTAQLGAKKD
jgi:Tol biopolymer transport system component